MSEYKREVIDTEMLERVALEAQAKGWSRERWLEEVGITPEAHRWLRDTAELSVLSGSDIGAVRMTGIVIGYELAREIYGGEPRRIIVAEDAQ